MSASNIFTFAVLISFLPFPSAAALPFFSEVLPNTEDDASLEYFSVSNASCEPFSLSGYSVSDAAGKTFAFGIEDVLSPRWTIAVPRNQSKITLNNEDEILRLFDPFKMVVDEFSYASSSKGVPVFRTGFPMSQCALPESEASAEADVETDVETGSGNSEIDRESEISIDSAPAEHSSGSVADSATTDSLIPTSIENPASESEGLSKTQAGASVPETWSGNADRIADRPEDSASVRLSNPPPPPAVFSTPSPVAPVSTSRASPDFLTLSDTDFDGRFDTVEVRYSENLSGMASPEDFALYSASGGLYFEKVPTVPGYFASARISWNLLILTFSGTTLQKPKLKISASTSSEFRMKSLSPSKLLTQSSGLPAQAIGLTTSFSGYSSGSVAFVPPPPDPVDSVSDSSSKLDVSPKISDGTMGNEAFDSTETESSAIRVESGVDEPFTDDAKDGFEPEPPQVPEGFEIVASSWVDRISPGKYRYVCFSSTSCPVSFKAEGIPKGAKGHWEFSDGRIRNGTSTSTLGKKPKATYSLSYVLKFPNGTIRFPLSLVVGGEELEKVSDGSVRSESFVTAASAWSDDVSTWSDSSWKASDSSQTRKPSPLPSAAPSFPPPSSVGKMVSAAIAALFLWLFGGAWFSSRYRTWRPEETP